MLRLAADENFNHDLVRGLLRRRPDLDLVSIQSVGLSGADDSAVLTWAAHEQRVLLTHDAATIPHHAYRRIHAGQPRPQPFRIARGEALRILPCALLALPLTLFASTAPQVKTELGVVEGKDDGAVRAFLGIPYGAPPVGDLRWKAPVAATKWTGVRKATEFGPHCMQGIVFDDMVFHDPGGS